MKCTPMELRPRWTVTAASVPAETGSAQPWPVTVSWASAEEGTAGQSSLHEITMQEVRVGMMEKKVVAGSKEPGQQVTDSNLSYGSSQKAALGTKHLSQTQRVWKSLQRLGTKEVQDPGQEQMLTWDWNGDNNNNESEHLFSENSGPGTLHNNPLTPYNCLENPICKRFGCLEDKTILLTTHSQQKKGRM